MGAIADGRYEQVGTFNGNPLTMAAARATLSEVLTPEAYTRFDHLGRTMLDGALGALRAGRPARLRPPVRGQGVPGVQPRARARLPGVPRHRQQPQPPPLARAAQRRGVPAAVGQERAVDGVGPARRSPTPSGSWPTSSASRRWPPPPSRPHESAAAAAFAGHGPRLSGTSRPRFHQAVPPRCLGCLEHVVDRGQHGIGHRGRRCVGCLSERSSGLPIAEGGSEPRCDTSEVHRGFRRRACRSGCRHHSCDEVGAAQMDERGAPHGWLPTPERSFRRGGVARDPHG